MVIFLLAPFMMAFRRLFRGFNTAQYDFVCDVNFPRLRTTKLFIFFFATGFTLTVNCFS